jgi:hypothetical protein
MIFVGGWLVNHSGMDFVKFTKCNAFKTIYFGKLFFLFSKWLKINCMIVIEDANLDYFQILKKYQRKLINS